MVQRMIHNTFLVQGRKVLASSQYWPISIAPEELIEFVTTRRDLLSEHGGSVDLPLIVGDKKFLARSVDSDRLLVFATDTGEDEHAIAGRLETAAREIGKKIKESGIRSVTKQYLTLIEPAITTRLKIALVGEGGVGKTTTLQLLLGNSPPLSYVPTIALNLETVENIRFGSYSLVLWDFAGQERFRTLWKFYFHGADVIFLVCDSTLRNVIVSKDILKLIRRDAPKVPVFALANKQDKPNAMKPEVIQKILGIPTYPMVAIDRERRDEMLRILITAAAQFVGVTLPDVPASELIRFTDQAVKGAAKGRPPAPEAAQPVEAEPEEVVEEVLVDEEGHVVEASDEYEVVEEVTEVVDEAEDKAVRFETAFEIPTTSIQPSEDGSGPVVKAEAAPEHVDSLSRHGKTGRSSETVGMTIAKHLISEALDADDFVAAEIDKVPREHLGAAVDAIRCEETRAREPEKESIHAVGDATRRDLDKVLGPSGDKASSPPEAGKMAESPMVVGEATIRELERIIQKQEPEKQSRPTAARLMVDDEED